MGSPTGVKNKVIFVFVIFHGGVEGCCFDRLDKRRSKCERRKGGLTERRN